MVVVEEGRVSGKAIHEEALDLVVAEPAPEQPEAREDPARVRVDHEERLAGRVERDRVGGLGSDPVNAEQAAAQDPRVFGAHGLDPPAVGGAEEVEKGPNPRGLHPEGPRGADQGGDARDGQRGEPREREPARPPQPLERLLDVRPGRVLDQDRAQADLERGFGGPPARRPEAADEPPVKRSEARCLPICHRPPTLSLPP